MDCNSGKTDASFFRTPSVRMIFSDRKEDVVAALNTLTNEKEGSEAESELIEIVRTWQQRDDYSSLWAMVALKAVRSRRAIPCLLSVLDSDADYWNEASAEALEMIALKHPDEIMELVPPFIEDRFDHDPFDARLFAYNPIAALVLDDRAKSFLVYAYERDDKWEDTIGRDLIRFGDRRVLELFKRSIEYFRCTGDGRNEREIRWLYREFENREKGKTADDFDRELTAKPWEERWEHQLNSLGKTDDELELESRERMKALDKELAEITKRDKEIRKEAKDEARSLRSYSIAPFNLGAYLQIRVRSTIESDCASALRLLGVDEQWTVESIQELINQYHSPAAVIKILFEQTPLPSLSSGNEFLGILQRLWNTTPRKEFNGLTPEEMNDCRQQKRNDVGRNDPCPCGAKKSAGSPLKFKHCHGA